MATVTSNAASIKSVTARNIPYLSLDDAIEKAKVFYQKAKRSAIKQSTAGSYFGLGAKSSSIGLFLSAMKKYGLLKDEGNSEGRQFRLTDLAYQIVADMREVSPERDAKIRQAALSPDVFRVLWKEYGESLPDDKDLQTHLMFDLDYTEEAARLLIKVYRRTFNFALAGSRDTMEADDAEADGGGTSAPDPAAQGRRAGDQSMDAQRLARPDLAVVPAGPPDASLRRFSIPLDERKTFDFVLPVDLTKEDYDFILESLRLWERKLVARPKVEA